MDWSARTALCFLAINIGAISSLAAQESDTTESCNRKLTRMLTEHREKLGLVGFGAMVIKTAKSLRQQYLASASTAAAFTSRSKTNGTSAQSQSPSRRRWSPASWSEAI